MWEDINPVSFINTPEQDADVSELLRLSTQSEENIIAQFSALEIEVNNELLTIAENQNTAQTEVEKITGMARDKPLAIPPDNDPLLSPNTENINNVEPRYVTVGNPNSDRYIVEPGEKVNGMVLDGVVSIEDSFFGDHFSTGTLLTSGKHILTAGHSVVDEQPRNVQVTFNLPSGDITLKASKIFLHPDYDNSSLVNDIAIIELESEAPQESQRYDIYRDDDEIGLVHTKVGYGYSGRGQTQEQFEETQKRVGFNIYDDFSTKLQRKFFGISSSNATNTQLAYDFDNGKPENDAFGRLFGIEDTGLGEAEVNSAVGDSGGPTFIDGRVAGITSYGFGDIISDVDNITNSSFGELSVDTRVSVYADWVDNITGTSVSGEVVNTDFNDDENVDVVWRNNLNGKNQLWLMDGVEREEIVELPRRQGKNWEIVGTGDFDDDENIDVVWRNNLNGKNQLWLMDGFERSEVVELPRR
ncbi:MAG: trypsin-like serine protease, partial [Microcoleaceae cyanobacterium]